MSSQAKRFPATSARAIIITLSTNAAKRSWLALATIPLTGVQITSVRLTFHPKSRSGNRHFDSQRPWPQISNLTSEKTREKIDKS